MSNAEKDPIDAEVVPPTQALTVRPQQAVAPPGLFGTTDPAAVIAKASEVATALKDVVVKQGLVSNISGKQYPKCEAWTLLGTMLGVFPVLVWTKPVEGGWEARVEARTRDGAVVEAAEAQCLKAEKNWANRDDFAVRSMAQTRATAKCLRMPLGFIMTLAGYEATPAEEMVSDHPQKLQERPQASGPPSGATRPPKASPPPPAAQAPAKIPPTPEQYRAKFIQNLDTGKVREPATQYLIDLAWLMPNEKLEDLQFRCVPDSLEKYLAFLAKMTSWSVSGKAEEPYERGPIPPPAEVPRGTEPPKEAPKQLSDWWRNVIVPIPRKGMKKSDYDRQPDTIGSLFDARHGQDEESQAKRQRLWGLRKAGEENGWVPKAREFKGKIYQPTDADKKFYAALKAFSEWFDENHKGETL